MSCEKWSVPCTIQRTSETSCNSLQLRFPLCPQWNHVQTKNDILSTRSTVASITALAYSFAWCPALTALYGRMLWTKCPRNIHERSIGFCGYTVYIENTSCRHYTSYQEIDGSTTFIAPSLQALKSALKQTGHMITGHQMSTNTCQTNPHSPN